MSITEILEIIFLSFLNRENINRIMVDTKSQET
jgi:hypothetical protein